MSTARSDNTMPGVWFAVGRCQHGDEDCQEAKMFGQRATIVSPDFAALEDLDEWLTHKSAKPSGMRCRHCQRQIAVEHFERRSAFVSTRYMIDNSVHA